MRTKRHEAESRALLADQICASLGVDPDVPDDFLQLLRQIDEAPAPAPETELAIARN